MRGPLNEKELFIWAHTFVRFVNSQLEKRPVPKKATNELFLTSPDNTLWRITIDDAGVLQTEDTTA